MAEDFEARVSTLAGGVPIALLPVRLEARFFPAVPELRVRIFPDQIHVDAHEPELTSSERDAGMSYWRQRFAAPTPAPATRPTTPWASLCAAVGPARAAWVARAVTPTNLTALGQPVAPVFAPTQLRPSSWSRAARAVALPERWVVIGKRGGREVCRTWTNTVSGTLDVTTTPDLGATPVADDALALQASARWLVDFEEAEHAGMAVRISPSAITDGQPLSLGFDRLFAFGVDWTLTPEQAADSLRQLFSSHVYTDGLSVITPGTPTNVTATARPGAPPSDAALAAALDPEHHLPASSLRGTGAERLWRGLGITTAPDDPLTAIPGAATHEQDVASQLANALWEATLGSFLTDFLTPVFPDSRTAQVRDHVRRWLFPAGPFPALRIARQPYGVLPVIAPQRFTPAAQELLEPGLIAVLTKLRVFWEQALSRVPHLGRSTNLDADVTALLQTTPLASSFRLRPVLGPLAVNATTGWQSLAQNQAVLTGILGAYLSLPGMPDIAGFAAHPTGQRLVVPLVDPQPLVAGARLSKNYLREIADLARTSGSFDAMKTRETTATTVLEALAVYAAQRELHRADMRTIDRHRLGSGQITALPDIGVMPLSEYVGIEPVPRPAPAAGVWVSTPSEASRVVIPTVTGQATVRQFVTAAIKRGATVPADYRPLSDMLASLEFLSGCPAEELDRALRGLLDAYSHRLDAWYTSLATRRLARVRTTASPAGVHLGGYGWLDDLRPTPPGAAVSQGFIHTPSLAHAATAAVLRSGHLAHHDADHQALNLDLNSARVRTAVTLLDGVAQGQPLAALLGYRFERALREHSNLTLAAYILPIRRLVPLRPPGDAPPTPSSSPSETIAARDVVDGVALLERWRTERAALFDALAPLITPQPARDALTGELDRLADAYDAVADVLTAEVVHQNVLGNNDRAGAALAALDRQGRPPRLEFLRTPRTGTSYTQRLLVLITDESLPPAWQSIPPDARAKAEPRLNAWIARLIGNPGLVRFAATVTGRTRELSISLDQLGLSPLALVMATHAPGHDAPCELEERLLHRFAAQLATPTPQTTLVLLDTAPKGSNPGTVGLGAFRVLMRWTYALITTQRAATARDLALPQDQADEGFDDAQLGARADALATAFSAALHTLETITAAPTSTDQALREALWGAADFGVEGSVPPLAPLGGPPPSLRDQLIAQARAVTTTMRTAATREHDLAGAAAGATPSQRAQHHTQRIRGLLGEQFPVLACFTATNATTLAASHAARATLCAGDDLAPATWLQRLSLVRGGVDRLARVRGAAELLHGGGIAPRDLVLLQLPHTPGERWLALPFTSTAAQAQLAIVAHCSGAVTFSAPLAGLFCDAWSETIPGREETTGIAFHHDAPGARAPQAVLLAVPPAATNPTWSVQAILDTLIEAHDLARIRAVGPNSLEWLGTVLPAILLPDSSSPDIPTANLTGLARKPAAPTTAPVLGKE